MKTYPSRDRARCKKCLRSSERQHWGGCVPGPRSGCKDCSPDHECSARTCLHKEMLRAIERVSLFCVVFCSYRVSYSGLQGLVAQAEEEESYSNHSNRIWVLSPQDIKNHIHIKFFHKHSHTPFSFLSPHYCYCLYPFLLFV